MIIDKDIYSCTWSCTCNLIIFRTLFADTTMGIYWYVPDTYWVWGLQSPPPPQKKSPIRYMYF